jgi:hypothetical protein
MQTWKSVQACDYLTGFLPDRLIRVCWWASRSPDLTPLDFFLFPSLLFMFVKIQGVSEISTLILTGNRTHQKEQLFSLPFCRKTKDFPKTVHISKTKLPKNLKQPNSYEVDFLLYG